MKTFIQKVLGIAGAWLVAATASGQNYSIDWFTIDGGGGTSAGGVFAVSGTIGQADAGALSGGNYTVNGGFWAFAIQTGGAPTLRIQRSGPKVVISWTPNTPGFVLQESPSVAAPSWANSVSGAQNPVAIPINSEATFYRLRKP